MGSSSKTKAEALNIKFIPVPKGGTGEFQLLDRGILGIMKRKGSSIWTRIFHKNPDTKWDKEISAGIALECWGAITEEHILSAWNFEETSSTDSTSLDTDDEFFPVRKSD